MKDQDLKKGTYLILFMDLNYINHKIYLFSTKVKHFDDFGQIVEKWTNEQKNKNGPNQQRKQGRNEEEHNVILVVAYLKKYFYFQI